MQLVHDDDQVISAAAIHYVGQHRIWALSDDLDHLLQHRAAADLYVFEAASWVLASRRHGDRRRSLWMEPLPVVELVDRLRNVPCFRYVFVDEVCRIIDAGRQVGYERGRTLVQSGVAADRVQFLIEGSVRVLGSGLEPCEVVAPAAFGVEALLEGRPGSMTIEAVERAVCLEVGGAEFLAMLADSAVLARGVFRVLIEQAGRIEWAQAPQAARPAAPAGAPLQPIEKVFMLRAHPLLGRATVEQCLEIVAITREVPLAAGVVLFNEQTRAAVYLIVSGEIRLESDGQPTVVAGRGHTIGVAESLSGAPAGWRATVTADGQALYLDPDELFDVLTDHVDLLRSIFSGVLTSRAPFGGEPATTVLLTTRRGPELVVPT